jgi:hypothetical protein
MNRPQSGGFQRRPSSTYRNQSNDFPDENESINQFMSYERARSRERSRSRERGASRERVRSKSRDRSQSRERHRRDSDDENENYYNVSSSSHNYSNYLRASLPSAHELVSNKDNNERIRDLEKNNLHLKRMLQLVMNDPSRSIDRVRSSAPRLLVHRQAIRDPLGPPT